MQAQAPSTDRATQLRHELRGACYASEIEPSPSKHRPTAGAAISPSPPARRSPPTIQLRVRARTRWTKRSHRDTCDMGRGAKACRVAGTYGTHKKFQAKKKTLSKLGKKNSKSLTVKKSLSGVEKVASKPKAAEKK